MTDNILIYGKYQSLRVMLRLWLETLLPDHRIIEASDMRGVVELTQKHTPHMVIFDLDQFSSTEADTISTIKTLSPTLPVVVLSNNGLNGFVKNGIASGVDVCLPWDGFQQQFLPLIQGLVRASV